MRKPVGAVRPVEIEGNAITVQVQQVDRPAIDENLPLPFRIGDFQDPIVRDPPVVEGEQPLACKVRVLRRGDTTQQRDTEHGA